MEELIFATGNQHKATEVQDILDLNGVKILSLRDINFLEDIPETGDTMTENAIIKSSTIYSKYNKNVFADDSGLEVEALNMAPGLYSARYAGDHKDSEDNMTKLLRDMVEIKNRKARFRSVIALIWEGKTYTYEGVVNGTIAQKRKGEGGFGYDPIFVPDGYKQSFSELGDVIKNGISHRYNALTKMKVFLDSVLV